MTNKNIKLKLVTERGTLITFINGLNNYIDNENIKEFIKTVQEKLETVTVTVTETETETETGTETVTETATGTVTKTENKIKIHKRTVDGTIECGFSGNFVDKIKLILLENKIHENAIVIVDEKQEEQNVTPPDTTSVLDKINKKVTLYYAKEKRTSRTYLVGISKFLKESEIQIFCKKLQKILGTNSILNNDGDCGFNGNYTDDSSKKNIIRNYILTNTSLTKDLIDF